VTCGLKAKSQRVRWFTHPSELELVDRFFGARGWFDPCMDPLAPAAKRCSGGFDIREGQDALLLGWPHGHVFCNPPYSLSAEFMLKAAHAESSGSTALMLVSAGVGTAYWRELWPKMTACCFLCPRPKFLGLQDDGALIESEHTKDCAFVLFGGDLEHFIDVFTERGPIVRAVHRSERPQTVRQPSLFEAARPDMSLAPFAMSR
jgi:hypothetical protein